MAVTYHIKGNEIATSLHMITIILFMPQPPTTDFPGMIGVLHTPGGMWTVITYVTI